MESSSDINFMSMEGLPFEDQAKLQSILFGPEEKADMSVAGDNGLGEERRHVFNVHAQVFVPRTCQPVTPEVSHVPNHTYGMQTSIQMPDGRNILTNNAPLNNNMHMFNNMHHDHLQPEYLPLVAPHIALNQRLHHHQHQQQQQQQVLQQTHMHHNHANHMQQQHRAQIQLQQQQQQQPGPHALTNHHLHHDNHYQKTFSNYTPRNYNSNSGGIGTQNSRQEVPPRYQRKNYDRAPVGDADGRGGSRYHNKRVTVLQNPNSRRQQGGDSRLGPRFYRHTNGDYREQWRDGYRPEYRREYARKIDEDINSNMLKLQNGLEPKFEAGSAPSDVSDDERIVLNLNSGAMSPSSVKWPSEMSSTGSPVSRSLSPASSHASGLTSPPQAHTTEHRNNQQVGESSACVTKSELSLVERPKVTSTNCNVNDKSAAQKETSNSPENSSKGTNSGMDEGVRRAYVDDQWTRDFTSSDPNDEWSSIAPETPWLSGFVNDDQQLQDRIAENTQSVGERVSSEVEGTETEACSSATFESRRIEESWCKQNGSRVENRAAGVLNVSDGENVGSSHSKEGTEFPSKGACEKNNQGMCHTPLESKESRRSESSSEEFPKSLECGGSPDKRHKTTNTGLTAQKPKQGNKPDNSTGADPSSFSPNAGTEQQMTKNNDPQWCSKVSMPVSNSAAGPKSTSKPGSQQKQPNTCTAGPELKAQPPPGPPISQPPKAPQKSWAALVRHNLPADSQPALVISDEAPSATSKPAVSHKVETKDDDEVSDPGSDKLIRKLREYVSSTPLHHRPPSVHPRGLINRANWCYVNATLQALLACPPFYNIFKNMPRMKMKERGQSCTPVMDSIVEFVQEFIFMKPCRNKKQDPPTIQSGEPFAPDYVYSMLMKLKSTDAFKQGRQEDAEEFLTCVLNHIHEELVAVMGNDTNTSGDPNGAKSDDINSEEASDDWEQVGRKKKAVITRSNEMARSLVTEIFCGQIRSVLRSSGARESATLEPFFTLPLDIQHDKIGSVRDALAGLVSRESILGFTCSKTKEEVEATRCAMFEVLPPVLILHLKCFIYDTNGGCQKLNKEIEYTVDLEICKDIISPTARAKMRDHQRSYKLFAVVYHRGKTLQGGHYTTDVYHSGINGWIRIDDHNISVVPVTHVLRYEQHYMPYLLYYRRHDSLAQDRGAAKS